MKIKVAVIVVISLASFFVQDVIAGNIYKYRDAEGNILFTNNVSPEGKPQGKGENGEDLSRYEYLEKTTEFSDSNVAHKKGKGKKAEAQSSGRSDVKPKKSEKIRNKAALSPWTK